MYAWFPLRPEEGLRALETLQAPCGYLELNPGPLEEQSVLLSPLSSPLYNL